ncbi:hypothetical protein AKO1_002071, partial [Acrasis kona]
MAIGGNSQFNGMLFQSATQEDMNKWPTGWKFNDLKPYFERVMTKTKVAPTMSTDKLNYQTGIADAFRSTFNQLGMLEKNTSILSDDIGNVPFGYFSRPYLVSDGNGQRGGVVDAYLSNIIGVDGRSKYSNLDITTLSKVSKIVIDNNGRATGVEYFTRTSRMDVSDPSIQGSFRSASLNSNGRVILGAGAMIDTKLLYVSGVGPKGSESSIGPNLSFKINNPAVGQSFSDHIGIQLGIHYQGSANFNYNDRSPNNPDIIKFLNERKGPFTQYLPVLFAHIKSKPSLSRPNIEIMINPSGVGGYDSNVNAPNNFQVMLIHMSQKGKTRLTLDGNGAVNYPSVYFTNQDDLEDMVDALYIFLNTILPKNPSLGVNFGPGGYSHPNLNPANKNDCRAYITGGEQMFGISYSKMIMNHFTGTVPLIQDASQGGVDPQSLLVRGTSNIHVVDASIYPGSLSAHPVATVMAGAERASDLLIDLMDDEVSVTVKPSTPTTTTAPSSQPTTTAGPYRTDCWTCHPGYSHYWELGYTTPTNGDTCQCILIPTAALETATTSPTTTPSPT